MNLTRLSHYSPAMRAAAIAALGHGVGELFEAGATALGYELWAHLVGTAAAGGMAAARKPDMIFRGDDATVEGRHTTEPLESLAWVITPPGLETFDNVPGQIVHVVDVGAPNPNEWRFLRRGETRVDGPECGEMGAIGLQAVREHALTTYLRAKTFGAPTFDVVTQRPLGMRPITYNRVLSYDASCGLVWAAMKPSNSEREQWSIAA